MKRNDTRSMVYCKACVLAKKLINTNKISPHWCDAIIAIKDTPTTPEAVYGSPATTNRNNDCPFYRWDGQTTIPEIALTLKGETQ